MARSNSTIGVEDILPKGINDAILKLDRTFEELEYTIERLQKASVSYNKINRDAANGSIISQEKLGRAYNKVNKLAQERIALQRKTQEQQKRIASLHKQMTAQIKRQSNLESANSKKVLNNIRKQKAAKNLAYNIEQNHLKNLDRLNLNSHNKIMRNIAQQKAAQRLSNKGTGGTGGGISSFLGKGGLTSKIPQLAAVAAIFRSIIALARGAVKVAELIAKYDGLAFKMGAVLGGQVEVGNSMAFLNGLVQRYGGNLLETANQYVKFTAAAKESHLSMSEGKKIFESVTKAGAVLGLSNAELNSTYIALEQMLSKGKISAEELRRQLGNSLPASVEIMAKSMRVGTGELEKMLKMGQVMSAEVLPMFAQELDRAYGDKAGAKLETMRSQIDRVGSSTDRLLMTVLDSRNPIIQVFNDIVGAISEGINWLAELLEDAEQARERIAGEGGESIRQKEQERIDEAIFKSRREMQRKEGESSAEWVTRQATRRREIQEEFNEEYLTKELNLYKEIKKNQEELDSTKESLKNKTYTLTDEEMGSGFGAGVARARVMKLQKKKDKDQNIIEDKKDEIALLKAQAKAYKDLQVQLTHFKETEDKKPKSRRGRLISFTAKEISDQKKEEILLLQIRKKAYEEIYANVNKAENKRLDALKRAIEAEKELLELQSAVKVQNEVDKSSTNLGRMNDKLTSISAQNKILSGSKDSGDQEKLKANKATQVEIIKAIQSEKERSAREVSFLEFKLESDINGVKVKNIEMIASIKLSEEKQLFESKKTMLSILLSMDENAITEKYRFAIGGETRAAREIAILRQEARVKDFELEMEFIQRITAVKIKEDAKVNNLSQLNAGNIDKKEFDSRNSKIDSISSKDMFSTEDFNGGDLLKDLGIDIDNVEKARLRLIALGVSIEGAKTLIKDAKDSGTKLSDFFGSEEFAMAKELMNEAFSAFSQFQQFKIDSIEEERAAMQGRYDEEIALAEGNDKLQKTLENKKRLENKKYDEKVKKEKNKQAKIEKAAAISNIVLGTAQSIVKASPNVPLMVLAGAIGAIQLATAVATPLPKYKHGTDGHIGGKAIVGDGGRRELILNPDGKMQLTKKTAHVVEMEKGAMVIPDADDYIKNMVMNSLVKNYSDTPNQTSTFNQKSMEKTIDKAFSKAKITNYTNLPKIDINYDLWKGSQIDF